MAFGLEVNTKGPDAGFIRGTQMEIACECWFTSKGKSMPVMIKFQDEDGMIQTVRDIQIQYSEEKNYSGIPSVEYDCAIFFRGMVRGVKLIFFKEECRWVMSVPGKL